jgi:hypothetical protein
MNIPAPTRRPLRSLMLMLSITSAHAVAEPVSDPTRPMAGLFADGADVRLNKPARTGTPAPSASPASGAAAAAPARLQSVRLASHPSASTALLDGRLLHLGDAVGERTLVAIDRHGITLRGPGGELRLSLLAGIRQTASREAPPGTATLATGTLQDTKP